jgi:hypothetical protein
VRTRAHTSSMHGWFVNGLWAGRVGQAASYNVPMGGETAIPPTPVSLREPYCKLPFAHPAPANDAVPATPAPARCRLGWPPDAMRRCLRPLAQEARVYDYEASYMAGGSSGALYHLTPLGDAPCAAALATSDPASQTLQPSARS